ncbi:hypothetical protein M8C21_033463 [Ambrosia artemisiifolia]|uniref:Uncharacterized protein n=1 Tax=Ambrosia artemisiifolia TaxID=4212 RepID=A0AAD5GJZ1_AMBAR|nr:hypothetical protein M8C21_033463 [Ambrosia artemisiifolia]
MLMGFVGLQKILTLLQSVDSDVQTHAVKVVANLAAEVIIALKEESMTSDEDAGVETMTSENGCGDKKNWLSSTHLGTQNMAIRTVIKTRIRKQFQQSKQQKRKRSNHRAKHMLEKYGATRVDVDHLILMAHWHIQRFKATTLIYFKRFNMQW